VWRFALEQQSAPLLVLLSGGYSKGSAGVIIDSLDAALRRWCGLGGGGGAGGSGGGSGSGSGGDAGGGGGASADDGGGAAAAGGE
jgi:hypothetical protein